MKDYSSFSELWSFLLEEKMFKKKNKELTEEEKEVIRTKSFFDMILPSTIKFSRIFQMNNLIHWRLYFLNCIKTSV